MDADYVATLRGESRQALPNMPTFQRVAHLASLLFLTEWREPGNG